MIYPKFIELGDKIGVCAPSDGINNNINLKRFDFAKENIEKIGFNVVETKKCRNSKIGRSADSKIRAAELVNLFVDDSIKSIICLAGGDFLLEILPYIDFKAISSNPKWIQGYSDPTGLLFTITTNLDIATIYGYNFKTFGMSPWHASLKDDVKLLQGKKLEFASYDKYEENSLEYVVGNEGFNLDKDVTWEILGEYNSVNMQGRIIGGCLDVILSLVGTRFDKTKEFIKKYKEDGIIWFFDNCELTSESVIRAMWQLNQAGFFENTKGIIFGRSATDSSFYNVSFKEAVETSFNGLNIPIILNADIGHKPPQIPVIIGSIADVSVNEGKGTVKYILK